ncbi:tocopherol cyclase family protein [Zongyangia hominis]|uniref:Stress response protein nst1 n=1 Tax=Zongyangia hominis TaxID=2763677 RepID=A0A926EBH3_9FIRM|nr:tocopherol cyclase family protein [Zongyangia hominis]MBC8570008.1 stress response protein nst1 [Zongyangia hominis]
MSRQTKIKSKALSPRYFEGWYYKHQAAGQTLALISGRARDHAFIQAVTDKQSYRIPYPLSQYRREKDRLWVGESLFSSRGIQLNIHDPALSLTGDIRYGRLSPIDGDIMGPFRFLPMQCRHGVVSMRHKLSGAVELDGKTFDFTGGTGYIESDRGRSFPESYVWVQSNDFHRDCSILVSVATIPLLGLEFPGCICVVQLDGHEYRLATYNGVKIRRCQPGAVTLTQGKYRLDIRVDDRGGHALQAPQRGAMTRTIHENAACPARFRFWEGDTVLFDEWSHGTGYEYVPLS